MSTQKVTVSIENLAPNKGTFLTPLWFGFHDGTFDTYDRGRPASPGLERLAEDGTTETISNEFDLARFGTVQGTILGQNSTPGPIDPGEIATFTVELDSSDPTSRFFNYASMIIPSNDFFIANGNERLHPIYDEAGNFIGADFIVLGSNVLDAGSEVNDEIPTNTAFFGQQNPDTGVPENGVVVLGNGFIPGGNILSDPRFANADYTAPDYEVARIRVFLAEPTPLPQISVFAEPETPISEAEEEPGTFIFKLSEPAPDGGLVVNFTAGDTDPDPTSRDVNIGGEGTTNIDNFNIRPLPDFISTVTISAGATEARLVVTPFQDNLKEEEEEISIDLLPSDGYTVNADNSLASLTIVDEAQINTIVGSRDRDTLIGTEGDDSIRGLRGSDELFGNGGNDELRGGRGQDSLYGGDGDDSLWGDRGADWLNGGVGNDFYRGGDGKDIFFFGGDLLDGQQDLDIITNFEAQDTLDFSEYLAAGGQISFSSSTFEGRNAIDISLSGEDTVTIVGDLKAAERQLALLV